MSREDYFPSMIRILFLLFFIFFCSFVFALSFVPFVLKIELRYRFICHDFCASQAAECDQVSVVARRRRVRADTECELMWLGGENANYYDGTIHAFM